MQVFFFGYVKGFLSASDNVQAIPKPIFSAEISREKPGKNHSAVTLLDEAEQIAYNLHGGSRAEVLQDARELEANDYAASIADRPIGSAVFRFGNVVEI